MLCDAFVGAIGCRHRQRMPNVSPRPRRPLLFLIPSPRFSFPRLHPRHPKAILFTVKKPSPHLLLGLSRTCLPARTILRHQRIPKPSYHFSSPMLCIGRSCTLPSHLLPWCSSKDSKHGSPLLVVHRDTGYSFLHT